jgi:hypothetical protein
VKGPKEVATKHLRRRPADTLVALDDFVYSGDGDVFRVAAGVTRINRKHPMLADAKVRALFAPLDSARGKAVCERAVRMRRRQRGLLPRPAGEWRLP